MMKHSAGVVQKLRYYRQILMWRRREKTLLERFDAVCVCSDRDRIELQSILGDSDRISVLPNGFAAPTQEPRREPVVPPRIGFVGSIGFGPNGEGVRWFIERVWPKILQRMPLARLRLVGEGTENGFSESSRNIDGLGWVANVESEMATWSLAVVPIFVGGGTRIKTAEAFSRKCPVVSTTFGVYGYEVVDGREVLIADSAEEFASKCLRLLADPTAGVAMAEVAWQRFLKHWTWDSYADRVADIVNGVLQTKSLPANQVALAAHGTSQP
jgi:glycosyltransferase involved in cell wall biosynthesis